MAQDQRPTRPKIVIIGGGFAGINLAKKLRKAPVDIVLLDKHNYHTFQPLLYQVATGALQADFIAFPLRSIFRRQKNLTFHLAEVQKINAEQNSVDTTIGPVPYDFLVLATGSATNFFGNKQLEHFTMDMKSAPQALNLRSMILQSLEKASTETDPETRSAWLRFVIVGGGPTGIELAGALAELRKHILPVDYPTLIRNEMKVYVIESKPRVLGVMSEEASKKAKEYLDAMGVVVYNNVRVNAYDGEIIQINNGETIRAKNVIWAAGVLGEVPEGLFPEVIKPGNRIETDNINRVKGSENIFAIGDVAAMITGQTPNGHPGVAQVAIQQGRLLAKNILAVWNNQPVTPFEYKDKGSLATIGRNKAVADIGRLRFHGVFAWLLWSVVHLLSLVGFRNRFFVFITWIGKYFTYNSATRLIIRPFNRDLMVEDTHAK